MLYLNPPYHIIRGVSVFPDHADPRQYYYLPLRPRLTMRPDPATGQRVPQLRLIEYRGEAGDGGFLNFDVNLGIDDDVLEQVRDELRSLESLDQTPRLVPVPLVEGTVRLILFGRESGQEDNEENETGGEGPRFVLRIDHSAKPTLFGDNQAAFSVELDPAGVAALKEALAGQMTPLGVVYSLEYLALRPAYAVRIDADWKRVQKHFEKRFEGGLFFSSVEIGKAVDKLIENQDLVIETDTFVPEDEANDVIGRREQAVTEVKEMLLQTFFEPTLEPRREEEDNWDRLLHIAERSSLLAATGGLAGVAQFSYKKVKLKRLDKKDLTVNLRERTTVRRRVFPQGHLQGLAGVIRDGPLSLEDFIVQANLDDPWFQRRRVKLVARGDFATDGIQSLDVSLRYGRHRNNVILDQQNGEETVEWPSLLENGALEREVHYRYRVTFRDADATQHPARLESEERIFRGDTLEIDPRAEELYYRVAVPIVADRGFPWERYPQVEVRVRYTDEANGIRQDDTFRMEKDSQDTVWRQFVLDPEHTGYRYRLTFHGADHRDVERGWAEGNGGDILLEDPFPRRRRLLILPALDWEQVRSALVTLRYEDPANERRVTENVELKKGQGMQTFTADLVDPEQRRVSFDAVILFRDGRVREIPPSSTFDERLIISTDMLGHRVVTVVPEERPFDEAGLERLEVELAFQDEAAGLSFADRATLRSRDDRFYFEYDYADAAASGYRFRVARHFANGMSRSGDWQTGDAPVLRPPLD